MRNKLYRSSTDKVFAGVCAGIAEYFGWEVSTVRLVTFIACLIWGAGVWAYIAAAILIPEESGYREL